LRDGEHPVFGSVHWGRDGKLYQGPLFEVGAYANELLPGITLPSGLLNGPL